MSPSVFQMDHIVLLLPYKYLTDPPKWLTSNFTLSPGGRHADNKTENRLILFRDGTYLELIAFIDDDPARREGHWWDKPFGIIDFALTTDEDGPGVDFKAMAERLERSGSGVGYAEPQEGGRKRDDGVELKWRVTFPTGVRRAEVPFWCEDVTPRERRVPVTKQNSEHPCGVEGVAGLRVATGWERVERCSDAMAAVLDMPKNGGNRYVVGLPEKDPARKKLPRVEWRADEMQGGNQIGLRLTLLLQTADGKGRESIREKIGEDGLVLIEFE